MTSTAQLCEIKRKGPYLTSISYNIVKDCSVKIKRYKWVDGHLILSPLNYQYDPITGEELDINSWNNQYDIIDLGKFVLKIGDVIDIQHKWDTLKYYPINIGGIEKEGLGSDKFYITFPDKSCFKKVLKKTQ